MIAALTATLDACDRAADFLRRLQGWRRMTAVCIAGALSALSFAPFGIFPLLLLSFGVLVLLLDGAQASAHPIRASAFTGWAYGFGQFAAGLYWVAYAFLVDPLQHAWQIPFVALLFPGGLALFIAFACGLAAPFWRNGWVRVFAFTAAYAFAEWLRGHVLTGFPWNLPGYGWGTSLAVMQSAAIFGVYGLSLLTILFGASLALFCGPSRAPLVPVLLALVFASMWIGGTARLSSSSTQYVPNVRLRIVQPNVAQADKYRIDLRARHWQELIDLSRIQHGAPPTHIIWPEAAPPFLLARSPRALSDIAALTANGTVLTTGAARVESRDNERPIFHNSFYVFGRGARLLATYDKFHLVPFGEYVPFPEILHVLGIDKLVNQPGSFTGGDGPHTYTIPGAPPLGPLICYEILFPREVTANPRPGWFVNVTDDSWFGPASSTGPYQHLLVARTRAIEEGIPVVRVANTGISAIIDPLGRVVAELSIGRTGILDSPLPKAISPTPFSQIHGLLFWTMLLICAAIAFIATFRRG
ncbi:MAG TPA: apolipoprotein N-acyltransferase [Rhizomicrobium sp.]|jgi:apolipoprotein N-acyltransferase|nr:apolipoprotein N-acyltransferase [Rhizomicrobium sp.]